MCTVYVKILFSDASVRRELSRYGVYATALLTLIEDISNTIFHYVRIWKLAPSVFKTLFFEQLLSLFKFSVKTVLKSSFDNIIHLFLNFS